MSQVTARRLLLALAALLAAGCGEVEREDARPADGRPDRQAADALAPDGPLAEGHAPDMLPGDLGPDSTTAAPVLLSGGIGGLGPVSSGGIVLLEGSFVHGEALCVSAAGLCLSGGVGP